MSRRSKYTTQTGVTADVDAMVSRSGGFLTLMGYSAHDADPSGGAATDFRIVDGATGSGGTAVAFVEMASNGSETQWFGPDGIEIESGNISIDAGAGTSDVTIYHRID